MLAFDPLDPFPLLDEARHSYAEAQAHAALVDEWLGLQTDAIEASLSEWQARTVADGQERWAGLPIKSLMTPYTELRLILEELAPAPGETIVDFGAAYGRLGFVIAKHAPAVGFIGYELIAPRANEGRRRLEIFAERISGESGLPRCHLALEAADLRAPEFIAPRAEYYFMYDFGSREAIDKILAELFELSKSSALTVVGRGGRTRDAIERHNPWLSQVVEPKHHPHYSIYSSGARRLK